MGKRTKRTRRGISEGRRAGKPKATTAEVTAIGVGLERKRHVPEGEGPQDAIND